MGRTDAQLGAAASGGSQKSGCGEKDRFAASDDEGVFVMGGETGVGGANGAAIGVEGDAAGAGGDDGFKGDDQAFSENVAGGGIGVIWDGGRLMDSAADTVAAEFTDDMKAMSALFALDGAPDVSGAIAGAGGGEGLAKGALGAMGEFLGLAWSRRNQDAERGIGVIAILFRGEVQFDEIAGEDDAAAGNAVDDFVVDANADIAGKTIDDGRRRARAVLREDACADFGKLGGGDAWADFFAHDAEGFGDDEATCAEFFKLFCSGDGHCRSVAGATATAATAATTTATREGGGGFGGGAVGGGAEDGELESGLPAGAFGAGDLLLLVEDQFFKLGLAIVADVFVDWHLDSPLLQRYFKNFSTVIPACRRMLFCTGLGRSNRSWLGTVTRK